MKMAILGLMVFGSVVASAETLQVNKSLDAQYYARVQAANAASDAATQSATMGRMVRAAEGLAHSKAVATSGFLSEEDGYVADFQMTNGKICHVQFESTMTVDCR